MKPIVQKVIAAILLLQVMATAVFAIDSEKAAEQDFVIRQQNLLDRYEDYYTRLVLIDRETMKRERGATDMNKERAAIRAEFEKIRREFKRARPEENRAAELEYERETKARKKELDRTRAEYVRQRMLLEKMESGASRIPAEEELGITMENETL